MVRRGEWGMEVGEEGGKELIYLSLHCHLQNDSCIKMGSDELFIRHKYVTPKLINPMFLKMKA